MRGPEFESIYAEHAESLLAFLAYRTGDRRLAEDLTADTFERILRSRGKLDRRKSSTKTWVYTIAINLLRDHKRREAVHQRSLERTRPVDPGDTSLPDLLATRDSVHRALQSLGEEEREAVALRFGADLTFPEIAKLLGCPVSTAEGRTHRALAKLKDLLQEEPRASSTRAAAAATPRSAPSSRSAASGAS